MRIKVNTDHVVSAFMVATCLFAIATMLDLRRAAAPPPSPLANGDFVQANDVEFSRSSRTLILALQSGCKYCTASMPFYRQLLAECSSQRKDARLQIVAVSPEPSRTFMDYLSAHALEPDGIATLSAEEREGFRIPGTPTMLMTNDKGVIQGQWFGQISDDKQPALLNDICGEDTGTMNNNN